LVEGWDGELPLQQAEGVLEEEDNPICFQLVEDKGQLLFQLVEEGNGVFFFQQVVEGDGILFFQLVVGDDQLFCLEEEGGVDHVCLQGEGDDQLFCLEEEGGIDHVCLQGEGVDQLFCLDEEGGVDHVCLQGEGDDQLFCLQEEVCKEVIELLHAVEPVLQLPVFWLVGEGGKALLFQMGVDGDGWQLCHMGDEEGGAHVEDEEGGDMLDVQLFYDAGVCLAAETFPKSHVLHHCHNPSLNLLSVHYATGL